MQFLYQKLFADTVNEIKSTLKPSFRRPYLHTKIQNAVSVKGLYDTGADISCLSLKVFRQIPPELRPKKLDSHNLPKFKAAGGQILPVCGRYQFRVQIGTSHYSTNSTLYPIWANLWYWVSTSFSSTNCGTARRIVRLPGKGSQTGVLDTSKSSALRLLPHCQ